MTLTEKVFDFSILFNDELQVICTDWRILPSSIHLTGFHDLGFAATRVTG